MTDFKTVAEGMIDLQARKNADYGNSYSEVFGEFGLVTADMMLSFKIKRFKTLRNGNAKVSNESIEDTLIDLAAYALMTVVELRNGEPKPTASEVFANLNR